MDQHSRSGEETWAKGQCDKRLQIGNKGPDLQGMPAGPTGPEAKGGPRGGGADEAGRGEVPLGQSAARGSTRKPRKGRSRKCLVPHSARSSLPLPAALGMGVCFLK